MSSEESRSRSAPPEQLPASGLLLLVALTFFWGGNWPALKIALGEIPVWTLRTVCLFGGGFGLLLLARLSHPTIRIPRADLGPLLLVTLFNIVGWHLCSGYGVSLMPAGRAAIIAFTMPLWAAVLSPIILNERLTAGKMGGLAMGLCGIAVLIGPDIAALKAAPMGALFMLLAAMSWAGGTVGLKRFDWGLPTTALIGWQLVLGGIPVALGALWLESPSEITRISPPVLLAVLYIVAFPILFCHWGYATVVRLFPAVVAATGTLAIPVVGVFASAAILGEPVGLRELAALALVCTALFWVLVWPALAARAANRAQRGVGLD